MNAVETIWTWVKRSLAAIGVVGCLIIGVAVGRLLSPAEVVKETVTKFVTDSAAVKASNDEVRESRERETGFLKKILGLEKQLEAREVIAGNDDPFDYKPPELIVLGDTVYKEQAYPYDLIFYGSLDRGRLEISTLNPYVRAMGGDYVRIYRYDLPENWDKLEFISMQSTSLQEKGLKVSLERDFVRWDGLWFGSALDYERGLYFYTDARINFYGVDIRGNLSSIPSIGVEASIRLY